MDPDDEAFEAALATQRAARRVRFERTVARLREIGLPIDDQLAPLDLTRDDALGRPTIARALIAGRLRDERRGRVPAADRLGRARLRPARGDGPARGDRGDPRRRRRAGPRPLLRGARARCRSCASSSRSAWPGSRSTTSRSSPRRSTLVGAVAAQLGPARDRRLRLPRRHVDLRRGARRAPRPGRGRRAAPRGHRRSLTRSGRIPCPGDDPDPHRRAARCPCSTSWRAPGRAGPAAGCRRRPPRRVPAGDAGAAERSTSGRSAAR